MIEGIHPQARSLLPTTKQAVDWKYQDSTRRTLYYRHVINLKTGLYLKPRKSNRIDFLIMIPEHISRSFLRLRFENPRLSTMWKLIPDIKQQYVSCKHKDKTIHTYQKSIEQIYSTGIENILRGVEKFGICWMYRDEKLSTGTIQSLLNHQI
jgi:hypothetical protein